jgi:hypothetical protein
VLHYGDEENPALLFEFDGRDRLRRLASPSTRAARRSRSASAGGFRERTYDLSSNALAVKRLPPSPPRRARDAARPARLRRRTPSGVEIHEEKW